MIQAVRPLFVFFLNDIIVHEKFLFFWKWMAISTLSPRFKKFGKIRLGSKLMLGLIYGLSFRIQASSYFTQSWVQKTGLIKIYLVDFHGWNWRIPAQDWTLFRFKELRLEPKFLKRGLWPRKELGPKRCPVIAVSAGKTNPPTYPTILNVNDIPGTEFNEFEPGRWTTNRRFKSWITDSKKRNWTGGS